MILKNFEEKSNSSYIAVSVADDHYGWRVNHSAKG